MRGRSWGSAVGAATLLVVFPGVGAEAAVPNPGETLRVSVDVDDGDPDGHSGGPSISGDGRYVAFVSDASDLTPGDANGEKDVFVRDLVAGTTTRVSVDADGGDPNGFSREATISADGRHVAFTSGASDLVAGDGNGEFDVFVRDLVAGTTTRASVDLLGGDSDWDSNTDSLSGDGRYVAFTSIATDLVVGDGNAAPDVFVRDLLLGTTVRASVDRHGGDAVFGGHAGSLSADGRRVAFGSASWDLVPDDRNNEIDVFVRDLVGGTTVRASVNRQGGSPNDDSGDAQMSADGRSVAFSSRADNLVPDDTDDPFFQRDDVFVRDLVAGTTELASVNIEGDQRNGDSDEPSISGDGRYVAFASGASDLVPGDGNEKDDVFVRGLGPPRPVVSIGDAAVYEGDSKTRPARFTVSLSKPSAASVTVSYETVHGTTSADDIIGKTGSLTLTAGQTSRTISIPVSGDTDA
ncbi:MAG: TolB family protein, partial [Actinomycetota bacterium]